VTAAAEAAIEAAGIRTLRVLEVGAGTGGTTAALLPKLPADRVLYQFTDVSDFSLARAQENFSMYPFVRYELLNLETDPLEQGYERGGFDVVVAANVLHATRNLDHILQSIHSLLAPGGVLLLYETTNHLRWYDITTGLIEGWQLFEDGWRGDNPLLPAPRWEEALHANGFEAVAVFPGADTITAAFGQHVIVARTPGDGAGLGTSVRMETVNVIDAVSDDGMQNRGIPSFVADLMDTAAGDHLDALVDFVRCPPAFKRGTVYPYLSWYRL